MKLGAVLNNARLDPDEIISNNLCAEGYNMYIENCPAGAKNEKGVNQSKCREYTAHKTLKGEY